MWKEVLKFESSRVSPVPPQSAFPTHLAPPLHGCADKMVLGIWVRATALQHPKQPVAQDGGELVQVLPQALPCPAGEQGHPLLCQHVEGRYLPLTFITT